MAKIRTGYRITPILRKVVSGGPFDGQPLDVNNNLCSVTGLPQATMPNPENSGTYLVYDASCLTPDNPNETEYTLSPFDHIIVNADWTSAGGDNLGLIASLGGDPTAIANPNTWDGKVVGPLADGVYRVARPDNDTNVQNKYLMWAGGNGYQSAGRETVYANVRTFVTNGDTLINNTLVLYLSALWEYSKNSGAVNLTITTYKNGTVSRGSDNFTISGGTQVNRITKTVTVTGTSYGGQNIATLRYNKVTTGVTLTII